MPLFSDVDTLWAMWDSWVNQDSNNDKQNPQTLEQKGNLLMKWKSIVWLLFSDLLKA